MSICQSIDRSVRWSLTLPSKLLKKPPSSPTDENIGRRTAVFRLLLLVFVVVDVVFLFLLFPFLAFRSSSFLGCRRRLRFHASSSIFPLDRQTANPRGQLDSVQSIGDDPASVGGDDHGDGGDNADHQPVEQVLPRKETSVPDDDGRI